MTLLFAPPPPQLEARNGGGGGRGLVYLRLFAGAVVVSCALVWVFADAEVLRRALVNTDVREVTSATELRAQNSSMLTRNPAVTCEIEEGKMSCFYAACSTHEGAVGGKAYLRSSGGKKTGCPVGKPVIGMRDRGGGVTYITKKNFADDRTGAQSLAEAKAFADVMTKSYRSRMTTQMWDRYSESSEGLCEILPGQETCYALRCSVARSDWLGPGVDLVPKDNGQDNGCPLCQACDEDKHSNECAQCLASFGLPRDPDHFGPMFEVGPAREIGWVGRKPWIVARERWGGYSLCQAVDTVAEGFYLRIALNDPAAGWTAKRPVQVCKHYQNFHPGNLCEWTKEYACPGLQSSALVREMHPEISERVATDPRKDGAFNRWLKDNYKQETPAELFNYCCRHGNWRSNVTLKSMMGLGDVRLQRGTVWPPKPAPKPGEFTSCFLSEEDPAWRSSGKGDATVPILAEGSNEPGKFAAAECATKIGCNEWERGICKTAAAYGAKVGGAAGVVGAAGATGAAAGVGVGVSSAAASTSAMNAALVAGAAAGPVGLAVAGLVAAGAAIYYGVKGLAAGSCNAKRALVVARSDNYNSVTSCVPFVNVSTEHARTRASLKKMNDHQLGECIYGEGGEGDKEACERKIGISLDFTVDDNLCQSLERSSKWGGVPGQQAGVFVSHPFSRGVVDEERRQRATVPEASGLHIQTSKAVRLACPRKGYVRAVCALNALPLRPRLAKDRLLEGEYLLGGQELYSATGGYRLVLYASGELFLVDHFHAKVWEARPKKRVRVKDKYSVRLMMRKSGELAIEVRADGAGGAGGVWRGVWTSGKRSDGRTYTVVQDNGAVVSFRMRPTTDVPYFSSTPSVSLGADRNADDGPGRGCADLRTSYRRDGARCKRSQDCVSGVCLPSGHADGPEGTCGVAV